MGLFEGKKVLVAGGAGFIGSHMVDALIGCGAHVSVVTRKKNSGRVLSNLRQCIDSISIIEADLKDFGSCRKAVKGHDMVLNYASSIGNIDFNKAHADIFRDNLLVELNMLEASRLSGVDRYLVMSSAFVYPDTFDRAVTEDDALTGDVSESKFGYGWSKRANEAAARAYFKQYGLKTVITRPSNVYGPRDNFFSGRGLVVPSFIEKVFSGAGKLPVAGNGMQVRNFIYVEDCVAGQMLALEKGHAADPINLATSEHTTIRSLAEEIIRISGKGIKIYFDESLSTGPKIMVPDSSKASRALGFKAKITLADGLRRTIEWFKSTYHA